MTRRYDRAATPYRRLVASDHIDVAVKDKAAAAAAQKGGETPTQAPLFEDILT